MRSFLYVPPVLLTMLSAGCLPRPTPPECEKESPPAFWQSDPQRSLLPPGIRTFCGSGKDQVRWFSHASGAETMATITRHLDKDKALLLTEAIHPFKKVDVFGKKVGSASEAWSYRHQNGGTVMVSVFQVEGNALEALHSYGVLEYRAPALRTER